jgi:hypothetical protein
MEFWPLQSPFEDSGVHQDSNSQSGTPLGCEGSFPHTFSHSQEYVVWLSTSLLARNLANPCLGREPKARVVTSYFGVVYYRFNKLSKLTCLAHLNLLESIFIHYNIFWLFFSLDIGSFLTSLSTYFSKCALPFCFIMVLVLILGVEE